MVVRIFAHEIVFRGKCYKMHVIELSGGANVRIYPYEEEQHSTIFYNGRIEVTLVCCGGEYRFDVRRL